MTTQARILLILLTVILSGTSGYGQIPKINELCASNLTILSDEFESTPDWIEIYNPGSQPLDLEGYGLSDNGDSLLKWQFPQYILNAGEYIVVFASGKSRSVTNGFWNGVITRGDEWKYIIPAFEPDANWREKSFSDSEWNTGATGIGYGDGDDATIIDPCISVFMRKSFELPDPALISEMILSVDYDDGFVAFINGKEVARANLDNGNPPAFDAFANQYTEPVMISGGKPARFDITEYLSYFEEGENVIAIQIHNSSSGSSDLTLIPFLTFKSEKKIYPDPDPVLEMSSSGFHTNFKLNKDGDSLYLANPAGQMIQLFPVEYNPPDHSLGFPDDSGNEILAFAEPTPWGSNTTEGFHFKKPGDIHFNKKTGYHLNAVAVGIVSNSSEDIIYYTVDGTDPDTDSRLYSEPVLIIGNNTIKARVINPGYLPGEVITGSFFTKKTNNLPSVFISTDPRNLFDTETGIYVTGNNAEEEMPYYGSNFWEDWEKPASIEFFTPSGDPGFNINAGIKIFGGWSRAQEMKSLSIFARNEYGDKSINYKVFDSKEIDKFEALVLRNAGNEWFGEDNQSGVMFRDLLITSITGKNDVDVQAGRPVVVYINGQYWGIHNLREKVNEHYVSENHFDVDPERVNLLVGNKGVVEGSASDYNSIENFISSNPMSIQDNYEYVKNKIDISNFINYEVAQIYFFNGDWPGNNIKFWKFEADYSKWRWIMYDTDFGLGLWDDAKVYNNSLEFATITDGPDWPNPPWSTFMLRNLLENEEFRYQFINTMADRMNSVFKPDSILAACNHQAGLIRKEMENHVSRWGGSVTTWESNIVAIKSFANSRPEIMKQHMLNFFGIKQNHKIIINISGADSASVNVNSLILSHFPWEGDYYDQVPVKLKAISPDGYRFVKWTGGVSDTEREITIIPSQFTSITAVFEPVDFQEYEGIVINEIAYNDLRGSMDWVELFNNTGEIKDLSQWILKDSDEDHEFRIKEGTLLMPYDYLVITENMEAFSITNERITNYTGNTKFGLNRMGECIRLLRRDRSVADSVCYFSEYPWPVSPLETGNPIALRDANTDNNIGYNWSPAPEISGTPGSSNLLNSTEAINAGNTAGIYLYQNFPNPFNSETRIAFELNHNSELNIRVYDLNGRLVKEIANAFHPAGHYEYTWIPDKQSPGIYILKLTDDKSSYQKRMILSR